MQISNSNNMFDYERMSSMNFRKDIPLVKDNDGQVIDKSTQKEKQQVDNTNLLTVTDNEASQSEKRQTLDSKQVIEFAIGYDLKADKELIGSQSNIEELDMTKAISDMKKDSVLHEYQYFVNNFYSPDGSVVKK